MIPVKDPSPSYYRPKQVDLLDRQLENALALREYGLISLAEKLRRCAYAYEWKKQNNLEYPDYRCGSRYCLHCSWLDIKENQKKYTPLFLRVIGSGLRFSELSFTIPNEPLITRHTYSTIFDCYNKLQRRKLWKEAIVGSLAKLETTYNPEGETYHPHLQGLLVYKKCVPQTELMDAWTDLIYRYFKYPEPTDYPQASKPRLSTFVKKLLGDDEESIEEGIKGAIGYISKPITFPTADTFVEYVMAIWRMPLIRPYGILRGKAALNSHYFNNRGYKSASASGARGASESAAPPRPAKQQPATVINPDATLRTHQDDKLTGEQSSIIQAAQRRLMAMRAERDLTKAQNDRERQAHRMPSSVECPECRRPMPPDRIVCEGCEACAAVQEEQTKNRRLYS
jgi:hypothetical protein